MVGWSRPASGFAQHLHRPRRPFERRADPDVIQASSLVGGGPVRRAVAPPRVELLIVGDEFALRVDPWSRRLSLFEFLDLNRSMANDLQERFVTPDIVFERR